MSAELKSLLLTSKSLYSNNPVSGNTCNLYEDTYGIEVVQVFKKEGEQFAKETLRYCQHFTRLSYWWYKRFYAVPAQIHWANSIITTWWFPNFICKLRGWR
jgi:hypothetical protein